MVHTCMHCEEKSSVPRAGHADDSGGAGWHHQLKGWWDGLQKLGAGYGYSTNANKTLLLVKHGQAEHAAQIFAGTGVVRVMTSSTRYLGSFIGEAESVQKSSWTTETTSDVQS